MRTFHVQLLLKAVTEGYSNNCARTIPVLSKKKNRSKQTKIIFVIIFALTILCFKKCLTVGIFWSMPD